MSASCPSCGAPQRDDARFCPNCGAALGTTCAGCGSALEPGDRFCAQCGAAAPGVPAPAAEPVPERRLVSVLFADLEGFTTLSEGRDPEAVRDMLERYFDGARR